MSSLIVVESPAKARTLHRYVGKGYRIVASVGHIRDLPKTKMGVDIDGGFKPRYVVPKEKKGVVEKLKKAAKDASTILIATDPDREGEAIGWHVKELLARHTSAKFQRVLFHEITKSGVAKGLKEAGEINLNLVEAQKARRILDRLVGYYLSPLLWQKVRKGLSAGRVQSIALKLVCDREKEREAFKPQEYWTVTAWFQAEDQRVFKATLFKWKGKKPHIPNEEEAKKVEEACKASAFSVSKKEKKKLVQKPLPPFTTAKLQQEAHKRFKFPVAKTMRLAQGLYEGKDLGPLGRQGLITYMRTDSVRVSEEAIKGARQTIEGTFGKSYLPSKPRYYKNRSSAQDAHEAIHPVDMSLTPEKVAPYLSKDEAKLYQLIYQRFLASQMKEALWDQTRLLLEGQDAIFEAKGKVLVFPGFLKVYQPEVEKENLLPELEEGTEVTLKKLEMQQKFTQPPPRFTEATLVKALEEKGIGRPSTYAVIVSKLMDRQYCIKEKQYFVPTPLGQLVSNLLYEGFPDIINESYTAKMEKDLDAVEEGKKKTLQVLQTFYQAFMEDLQKAKEKLPQYKFRVLDEACPQCGKPLQKILGKTGEFIGCTGYPECKYTRNLEPPTGDDEADPCDLCGSPMVPRKGRFGFFYGCSRYPECTFTRKTRKRFVAEKTGVPCPLPDCSGELVSRLNKKGKIFYGCSNYPDCTYAINAKPVPQPCPVCGFPFQVKTKSGTRCPEKAKHAKEG